MGVYGRDPLVEQLLASHLSEANSIVASAGSVLLKKRMQSGWASVGYGSISASADKTVLMFDPEEINDTISGWISQFETLRETVIARYEAIKEPDAADLFKLTQILNDIAFIQDAYGRLKNEVLDVEQAFENTVRVYRSPLRQALNDATLLYNRLNDIKGDYADFANVSVYVHGIESDGSDFLEDVKEVAEDGDFIIHQLRNSDKVYYIKDRDGIREVDSYADLNEFDKIKAQKGRLHIVYDTEHKNEHRQETSDDLVEMLTGMGLVNDATKIDMFAHSYGGRRSFQFAMDYPEHVRSVTTIGTPYDKNTLGKVANWLPSWGWVQNVANFFGKEPSEYSGYLDPNPKNQRTDDGVDHSNVYTDMASEDLIEDINHLKAANPQVYAQFQDIDFTAVAGYRIEGAATYPYIRETTSDDVVSVKSQLAESLGDTIDERIKYEVEGSGMLTNPGHVNEIRDEDFVNLIRQVNKSQKE
ncbi:alpha/beta fold hydrolase [Virgibacillus sp. 179-BFC.A HS]|uniref:Alpha/beta fold hydrolase n=1 Tax=Tigheibacillus jepli TaxID=3035914 RepID=A0ABU5CEE3_9BACI|nr:alpha/beta fold hydrolase [Virgibacillus sp. 179-BFC.A HS]MDY0404679.1 alpha/beta fold hydrolase [Virgibacillus sp. 179-BFC.A HS]